jgi:hypothetical protein
MDHNTFNNNYLGHIFSPVGTRDFSSRYKGTSPVGTRDFSSRYKGTSPVGTRGLLQ